MTSGPGGGSTAGLAWGSSGGSQTFVLLCWSCKVAPVAHGQVTPGCHKWAHTGQVWGDRQSPFGHDELPIWTLIQQPTCGNHRHGAPALWGTWVPLFKESPFTTSERRIWVGWG